MRSFLFFTLLTLVAAADKDKHKSSSIYETESHHHDKESVEESNSGHSESGLSRSPSSPETDESESKVKVTKKRVAVKKKKDETVEDKKVKKVVRSSKFPLQFTTKKPTKLSSEYDEDMITVDKKIYKDVGYRKDKFKERLLKEKRRDTTTNPNKKKKAKTTQKPTKKRHYTGYNALENASDLNYPTGLFSSPSVPVSPGEDMLRMFTINETVTAILNKEEIQVDNIKAGEILKDLKKKYHETQNELPTEERSQFVSFDKRSDNPIFNNSTLLDSGYDDDDDEDNDDDEDDL
uniref:Uncharacterized protein n=1 Tax=Cacopsylla melanoneura TaxID=428564 RepID=A0A8D8YZN6_9HEMI